MCEKFEAEHVLQLKTPLENDPGTEENWRFESQADEARCYPKEKLNFEPNRSA